MRPNEAAPKPLWNVAPPLPKNSRVGRIIHGEGSDLPRPCLTEAHLLWKHAYTGHWTYPVVVWGTEGDFADQTDYLFDAVSGGLWLNKGDAFKEAQRGLKTLLRLIFKNTGRLAFVHAAPGKSSSYRGLAGLGCGCEDVNPRARAHGRNASGLHLGYGVSPTSRRDFFRFAHPWGENRRYQICMVEHERVTTLPNGARHTLLTRRYHLEDPRRDPGYLCLTPSPGMALGKWTEGGVTPTPMLAAGVIEGGRVLEALVMLSPWDGRALTLVTTYFPLEMFLAGNPARRGLLLRAGVIVNA